VIKDIRFGALLGASVGAGVAIVLITLTLVRPFPWQVNGVIEHLTFRLCPLFILGFGLGSWASVFVVTIIGNAILYGATFGTIAAVASMYKRFAAKQNEPRSTTNRERS
jgi:ABC-type nitrate/sulfonate/bicarbonate transport system permease component